MAIVTTAAIGGVVGYLGTQLAQNKSIKDFFNDFTDATVAWIRPLFLKDDGELTQEAKDIKENPKDADYKSVLELKLKNAAKKVPDADKHLEEILQKISKTEEGSTIMNRIIGSKNISTGNISAGGSVTIGDNNNTDGKK